MLACDTIFMLQACIGSFVASRTDASAMALEADDLREIDELLLDYLNEGRVTPAYCRDRILHQGHRDSITSTYCGQRLQRLEEHGHVTNLLETGLYELVSDPRKETQCNGQT